MLTLRRAKPKDLEFLVDLRLATMEPHLSAQGIHLTAAQHRERVEFEYENFYLIIADGNTIGALKYLSTAACLDIKQLQIKPAEQGKGFGEAVLRQLIAKANEAGKALSLSVLKKSPALRLYQRMGFQAVGEDRHECHMLRPVDGQL